MSPSSRVADHCRAYALSYPGDPDYASTCNHEHDLRCDRCDLFSNVVSEIESALANVSISTDEKDEMKYVVSLTKRKIEAWKAHLLRSMNQDEARLDVLKNLDAQSVLLVLDWAMKYLPRKYRESQSDWFGKRGISWHITTATRKSEDELQMLTFVHIFQSCKQDSVTVLAIIDDVMNQLKTTMPDVNRVHFRQDNAGCYHSASTLLAIQQVAKKYDINVRLDFSDPQGGKGSCDRKAATVKNHMRIYLNSGQDVETADQMKNAIESSGGVPGVRATLCDIQDIPKCAPVKWEGVSFINNIEYSDEGMRVWRSFAVGPGKFLPWSQFNLPESYSVPMLNTLKEANIPKAQFTAVTSRRKSSQTQHEDVQLALGMAEAQSYEQSDEDKECHDKLFSCPEEGCVKSFQRFSSLQHHLDVGRHSYALENKTLFDKAMMSYATKLEQGIAILENPVEDLQTPQTLDSCSSLPMGWALKSASTQRTRLTESQKQYLTEVFQNGERTGRKADPCNVSKSMRKARNADGSSKFDTSSYLTSQQVASFFSRLAAKRVAASESQDEEGEHQEEMDIIQEQNIQDLSSKVMAEMSFGHPIMYDTHNICEIVACSKLSKFSIQMFQDICSFYQLDTSSIYKKRKKPYIDLLTDLVQSCSCKSEEQTRTSAVTA